MSNRLRRRLHSTSMAERVMKGIKRRRNAVGIILNVALCGRLIRAHLVERNGKWLCECMPYLDLDRGENSSTQHQLSMHRPME